MGRRSNKKSSPKKTKVQVPITGLEEQLIDKLNFLKRSIEAYDEGHTSDYRRMASTMRLLMHDTGASTSLLRQLKMEDVTMKSMAQPLNPNNLLTEISLVFIRRTQDSGTFQPMLDEGPFDPHYLDLQAWKDEIVIRDSHQYEFSRWYLVTVVADQDGGAHVDQGLDRAYFRLSQENSAQWFQSGPNGEETISMLERAYIRHIAWEALESIGSHWERILGNRGCECGSGRKARYCCRR